jgi:hypothetical protein
MTGRAMLGYNTAGVEADPRPLRRTPHTHVAMLVGPRSRGIGVGA